MGFSTEQNCPCVWPRPHLPTPQHTYSQWGLCNSGPKCTSAFPLKQETRICRALVFLPISCFATPSPDYFLYLFWFLSDWIPNQLFVRVHLETNCFVICVYHEVKLKKQRWNFVPFVDNRCAISLNILSNLANDHNTSRFHHNKTFQMDEARSSA